MAKEGISVVFQYRVNATYEIRQKGCKDWSYGGFVNITKKPSLKNRLKMIFDIIIWKRSIDDDTR